MRRGVMEVRTSMLGARRTAAGRPGGDRTWAPGSGIAFAADATTDTPRSRKIDLPHRPTEGHDLTVKPALSSPRERAISVRGSLIEAEHDQTEPFPALSPSLGARMDSGVNAGQTCRFPEVDASSLKHAPLRDTAPNETALVYPRLFLTGSTQDLERTTHSEPRSWKRTPPPRELTPSPATSTQHAQDECNMTRHASQDLAASAASLGSRSRGHAQKQVRVNRIANILARNACPRDNIAHARGVRLFSMGHKHVTRATSPVFRHKSPYSCTATRRSNAARSLTAVRAIGHVLRYSTRASVSLESVFSISDYYDLIKEMVHDPAERSKIESNAGMSPTRNYRIKSWLRSHRMKLAKAVKQELRHDEYHAYRRREQARTRRHLRNTDEEEPRSSKTLVDPRSRHPAPNSGAPSILDTKSASSETHDDHTRHQSSRTLRVRSASHGSQKKTPWYAAGPRHHPRLDISPSASPASSRSSSKLSQKSNFSTSVASSDATDERKTQAPSSYCMSPSILEQCLAARANGDTKACWTYKLYRGPDGKPPLTHYCRTLATSEEYAKFFLHEPLLGFDLEWKPNTAARGASIKEGISTIQLASESHIAVFHIALHVGTCSADLVAPTLRSILEDSNTIKAGVSILGDRTRLANYLGIRINAAFELSHLYRVVKYTQSQPKLVNRVGVSLTTQCEEHLGLPLNKDDNVRGSDWSKPLNMEQVVYAASDAYVAVHLYREMDRLRLQMEPVPDMPECAELKAERDARPKERQRPADNTEQVEDEELTEELLDDGDYTPATQRPTTNASPCPPKSTSTRRRTPKPKATPNPPIPPPLLPCPEILAADAWIASHQPPSTSKHQQQQPTPTLPPRILRTHHLFHAQSLNIPTIARLLRTPPLANFTVASYISEAVCTGGLEVDVRRAKEVGGALGPGRAKRWDFVVERRAREVMLREADMDVDLDVDQEQVEAGAGAGAGDEVDEVVGELDRLAMDDDDVGNGRAGSEQRKNAKTGSKAWAV